jgi:hypothetical protein
MPNLGDIHDDSKKYKQQKATRCRISGKVRLTPAEAGVIDYFLWIRRDLFPSRRHLITPLLIIFYWRGAISLHGEEGFTASLSLAALCLLLRAKR